MNHHASTEVSQRLHDGLSSLGIGLPAAAQSQLLAYLALLLKWNTAYNLTGIHAAEDMVGQLLLDSMVAVPFIDVGPIIDVGSGAGLPGIPLAIARPDLHFTLLDSNGKKTRFIRQVGLELQLPNIDVVQSRVEAFIPPQRARWVLSRAFSELSKFCRLTRHLLADDGFWMAWKGVDPETELANVASYAVLNQTIPVHLPGVRQRRNVLVLAPGTAG